MNTTRQDPILSSFVVERIGPHLYRGPSVPDVRRPVVFGGQIMAQLIAAAAHFDPAKPVRSLHVIFARAGTVDLPVEIALTPIQTGRAFATLGATAAQGNRVLSQASILLDAGEEDVIRHQVPVLPTTGPMATRAVEALHSGAEIRVVDEVDLMTSAVTGPPELFVWVRWQDLPDEGAMHKAALAWYTDPFLIGAAMRPHEGIGQEQAHETISTGVISHTLTFHEPFRADEWLLIANRSLHAGHGRAYGEGQVFTEAGTLVATFAQVAMIRNFRDGGSRGKAAGAM
jgi:acyl-CoA thioesterase II